MLVMLEKEKEKLKKDRSLKNIEVVTRGSYLPLCIGGHHWRTPK